MEKPEGLLSTAEVAELLGVSAYLIRKAVKEKKLNAIQFGSKTSKFYFDPGKLAEIRNALCLPDEKPAPKAYGVEKNLLAQDRQAKLGAEIDWYFRRLEEGVNYNCYGWQSAEEKIRYACALRALEAAGRDYTERNETHYFFSDNHNQQTELYGVDAVCDFFADWLKAIDKETEKAKIEHRREVATIAKETADLEKVTKGGFNAYGNIKNGTIAICKEGLCLGIICPSDFSDDWHKISSKLEDPILDGWEDGNGINCRQEGWLEEQEQAGAFLKSLFNARRF